MHTQQVFVTLPCVLWCAARRQDRCDARLTHPPPPAPHLPPLLASVSAAVCAPGSQRVYLASHKFNKNKCKLSVGSEPAGLAVTADCDVDTTPPPFGTWEVTSSCPSDTPYQYGSGCVHTCDETRAQLSMGIVNQLATTGLDGQVRQTVGALRSHAAASARSCPPPAVWPFARVVGAHLLTRPPRCRTWRTRTCALSGTMCGARWRLCWRVLRDGHHPVLQAG